jgi:hypothetical protein
MIIINPGTEARRGAVEANAIVVADMLLEDLRLPDGSWKRDASKDDSDGWFHFVFERSDKKVTVDIPGDSPEQVVAGVPFESRRLYVDGSSWLYGYAIGRIAEKLEIDQ